MPLRVAELETLFTANLDPIAKAETSIKASKSRIEKNPVKVDGDAKGALGAIDQVEKAARRVVSQRTMATVDANIERAEKQFLRVKERLDYLRSVSPEVDVKADISRAEAGMSKIMRQMDALRSAKTEMTVDVNTPPVEERGAKAGASFVKGLDGATRGAGQRVGDTVGAGVEDSLIAALTAIPVAGGIILGAVAIGKAIVGGIQDGMSVEVRQDRLQALTGVSETDARKLAFAAGEAYANVFGESVEANMDAARLGLQNGLIDPDESTRDAQRVIESLTGIADAAGQDVSRVAQSVTTLLKSGMAKDSKQAFDIIATGIRNGVDRGEDLLDTLIEYPAVLTRLGLTGAEMVGLLNQSLDAGARNSDVAADALKEFQIRATDASDLSAQGFSLLGLSAEEMTARIASGGEGAREGLDIVLDRLREMTDPVARNTAAVALFGTKAEDLGESLFAMDLSSAVEQLDGVTGSAQKMFDTLADNDASKMEQAKRNIDVAVQGIQGAFAQAFGDPLAEFAEWISQNRGPVLEFFLDLVNGALDFGDSLVEGIASGTEAVGIFISGPLAGLVEQLANFVGFFDKETGVGLLTVSKQMADFDDVSQVTADNIRTQLGGALDEARAKANDFGEGVVAMGYLNDASLRLAESLADVGSESGSLDEQVASVRDRLYEQIEAAAQAGESQGELKTRFEETRQSLLDQAAAAGLSKDEAQKLVDKYLGMPTEVVTKIYADTVQARDAINGIIQDYQGRTITLRVGAQGQQTYSRDGNAVYEARGGLVEFMAAGGMRGLTPMQPIAQVVPANTWRVVGDRGDVPESYIPLDGSARSMAILAETMRRMGVTPMGAGGVTSSTSPLSLDGLSITGRLEIDPDGFGRLVDAKIYTRARENARALRHGTQG